MDILESYTKSYATSYTKGKQFEIASSLRRNLNPCKRELKSAQTNI